MANATRAVLGTVRRSAVLNTRHSVRSVPGRSVVVYEVARGFSGGQEFATSINVANEDSVTGVTELGVQPANCLQTAGRVAYCIRAQGGAKI